MRSIYVYRTTKQSLEQKSKNDHLAVAFSASAEGTGHLGGTASGEVQPGWQRACMPALVAAGGTKRAMRQLFHSPPRLAPHTLLSPHTPSLSAPL